MVKEIWANLPVKDVKRTKQFFSQLGFAFSDSMSMGEQFVCMLVGTNNFHVLFFQEALFKGFTQNELTDTSQSTEVMFSIDAANRQEVDDMAAKAEAAGGNVFGKPAEFQGWMYGCAFADLDGHRWNMLFRDMEKMAGR
jgi:predicted lactoylglutathione lyase